MEAERDSHRSCWLEIASGRTRQFGASKLARVIVSGFVVAIVPTAVTCITLIIAATVAPVLLAALAATACIATIHSDRATSQTK
jgi:hypothetical protein